MNTMDVRRIFLFQMGSGSRNKGVLFGSSTFCEQFAEKSEFYFKDEPLNGKAQEFESDELLALCSFERWPHLWSDANHGTWCGLSSVTTSYVTG